MSKKKKVTAPVTYNPGKGRPKEYLAYLNWQEMQELQRINGGNMERGPKGLPSFPPAGAKSGASAKSPASTSTSKAAGSSTSSKMGASSSQSGGVKSSTASKSTTSGKMGSSSSQTGGVKSATGGGGGSSARPSGGFSQSVFGGGGGGGTSRPSTTVSRPSGVNLGGGGAGRDTSRGLGVGAGTTAIGRPASDKSAINAANRANTQTAQNTPALRSDQSRTIGVGPMGTPVNVRTAAPGSRISGAIKSIQQPVSPTTRGVGVPTATITNPMASQGASFATPRDAAYSNMLASGRLAAGLPASGSFPSPAQVRAQTEARLNAQRMAQQYSQYRSPPSMATQRLAQQYSQYRSPPSMPPADFTGANSPFADPSVTSYRPQSVTSYPDAPSGVYGPRAGVGVGYLGTAVPPGPTTGMPSPYSGTVQPRYNAESTLRAYEAEKRAPVTTTVQTGTTYKRGNDPVVNRALADAGFNPDGTRMSPAQQRAYQASKAPMPAVADPRAGFVSSNVMKTSLPPGAAIDGSIPAPTRMPAGFQYDNPLPSDFGRFAETQPPSAYTPAGVMSLGPYTNISEKTDLPAMASPTYSMPGYTMPTDATRLAVTNALVAATEATPASTLPAVPQPTSMGLLSPPPKPTVRPSDLMDSYNLGPMRYPGADGLTGEDIGGVFEEGDGRVPDSAIPGAGIRSLDAVPSVSEEERSLMRGYAVNNYNVMPSVTAEERALLSGSVTPPSAVSSIGTVPDLYSAPVGPSRPAFGGTYNEGLPPGYAETYGISGERAASVEGAPRESALPSQEAAAPSQDISITKEAEIAQENLRKKAEIARKIGVPVLNLAVPGAGTLFGQGLKYLNESTQKLVDSYQSASMTERKEMEEAFPNLIAHGKAMGINTYYGIDKYNSWADERGLRAPQSTGGGSNRGGIADISLPARTIEGPEGGSERPPSSSTPSGSRPYIYYEWDLGLNIPSPSDPKYTDYQKYLSERAAAQSSFGMV